MQCALQVRSANHPWQARGRSNNRNPSRGKEQESPAYPVAEDRRQLVAIRYQISYQPQAQALRGAMFFLFTYNASLAPLMIVAAACGVIITLCH